MFSSRLPSSLTPNPLTSALAGRRAAGLPILDLTQSNPTKAGFDYPPDLLDSLSDPRGLIYEPAPLGLHDARCAVASDYARRGVTVNPAQIALTASTSEAYSVLFKILCDPGDAVLVPRGAEYTWKQTETLRKYWVIFDRSDEVPEARPAFLRIEPDGPAGKGLAGEGRTKYHTYYETRDEKQSVGVWETKPHTSADFHETKYAELMVFLKGTVSLIEKNGREHRFAAGDVALVPRGVEYKWVSDTVRKYWVIFDPS